MKALKCVRGVMAVELLVVTSLLSAVSVPSYQQVKQEAAKVVCTNQLRQIGAAVKMFVLFEGRYPDAAFFPKNPLTDPRSIVLILEKRGASRSVFLCPTTPPELRSKGLSYLWNDGLSGKPESAVKGDAWMMVDFTVLDERIASHRGGYNVLYADGRIEWKKDFPKIEPAED